MTGKRKSGKWLGGSYDPEAFDLEGVNIFLAVYARHTAKRRRG